ncbi:MAG: metal-dependent transcriptional regulator [Melioribacteraceae bacterium]|nr:metal-dependent transcriptional regulator [Melioribacteraceae bacterium]
MITISKEDYIKEIYSLISENREKISTTYLADKLNVSSAAVSDMAKRLDSDGFITYQKYKGIELTEKGKIMALKILRRHRLWESFLMHVFDLSWNEVHDEAEKLEHQTSDFLINKIDDYLGNPEFDPHGDPIPDKNGVLPEIPHSIDLCEAEIGKFYSIRRVEHDSKELLDYLTGLGIELSKEIEVIDRLKFDNSVSIKIGNNKISFSEIIASKIFVALKKEDLDG